MKTLCPPVTAGAGARLDRALQGSTGRGPWPLVLVLCDVVTLAVLALGFWAMTQK